jgi:hypothetical protein
LSKRRKKKDYTRRQINKYQNMMEPGQILRTIGSWIPKEIFDMKLKQKIYEEDQDQDANDRSGKMSHGRKEKHETEFRWSFIWAEIDGETWLLDYQQQVKTSKQKEEETGDDGFLYTQVKKGQ